MAWDEVNELDAVRAFDAVPFETDGLYCKKLAVLEVLDRFEINEYDAVPLEYPLYCKYDAVPAIGV